MNKIYYKSDYEINLMKESGDLVSKSLGEVAKIIDIDIKTIEIDSYIESFILKNGGIPAFKGYNSFPYTLCISINNEVVHGLPSNYKIKNGDIISVDCGVFKNGFYADSAYTFPIGNVDKKLINLLTITKECLKLGIEKAIVGNTINDISFVIQKHAENKGYSVVKNLVGHGIGKYLHEDPEVPNYIGKNLNIPIKNGLVIAIEPMINIGTDRVYCKEDNWTIVTWDNSYSAHYEHTIAIQNGIFKKLTTFDYIDKELLKK